MAAWGWGVTFTYAAYFCIACCRLAGMMTLVDWNPGIGRGAVRCGAVCVRLPPEGGRGREVRGGKEEGRDLHQNADLSRKITHHTRRTDR